MSSLRASRKAEDGWTSQLRQRRATLSTTLSQQVRGEDCLGERLKGALTVAAPFYHSIYLARSLACDRRRRAVIVLAVGDVSVHEQELGWGKIIKFVRLVSSASRLAVTFAALKCAPPPHSSHSRSRRLRYNSVCLRLLATREIERERHLRRAYRSTHKQLKLVSPLRSSLQLLLTARRRVEAQLRELGAPYYLATPPPAS